MTLQHAAGDSQTISTARHPGQPRLTLAIPTWQRSIYLAELLEALLPQLLSVADGEVELLISDNCSEDDTQQIVAAFEQRGLPVRYLRNETNIGSDANFLQCINLAQGQYVWVMGDDDLLVPNALADVLSLLAQGEFDMVYLSSFAFSGALDVSAAAAAALEPQVADKLGRFAEEVTGGEYFLEKVNALIGLISVMVVNKNRLLATPHPPIESHLGSNLMQAGWLFPLVHRKMSVLYVWRRLVAYRSYNSGGWGVCEVFGVRLDRIARQYFATEPQLANALMNGVLRYWMCDAIFAMRSGMHAEMNAENFAADLRHGFSRNWRYWVFVYPVAELPLPIAGAIHRALQLVNRLTRIVQGGMRHLLHHGRYLRPPGGG